MDHIWNDLLWACKFKCIWSKIDNEKLMIGVGVRESEIADTVLNKGMRWQTKGILGQLTEEERREEGSTILLSGCVYPRFQF